MIPVRLIQTWRTAALPERARQLQDRCRLLNPKLMLCFFDDAAWRALTAEIELVIGPRMLNRLLDRGLWADISVMPQLLLMPPMQAPRRLPGNRHMATCL